MDQNLVVKESHEVNVLEDCGIKLRLPQGRYNLFIGKQQELKGKRYD